MDKKDSTINAAIAELNTIAGINTEIIGLLSLCSTKDEYENAGLGRELLVGVTSRSLLQPDISIKFDTVFAIRILHDILHEAHAAMDYDIYEQTEGLIYRVFEMEEIQQMKHWKNRQLT